MYTTGASCVTPSRVPVKSSVHAAVTRSSASSRRWMSGSWTREPCRENVRAPDTLHTYYASQPKGTVCLPSFDIYTLFPSCDAGWRDGGLVLQGECKGPGHTLPRTTLLSATGNSLSSLSGHFGIRKQCLQGQDVHKYDKHTATTLHSRSVGSVCHLVQEFTRKWYTWYIQVHTPKTTQGLETMRFLDWTWKSSCLKKKKNSVPSNRSHVSKN